MIATKPGPGVAVEELTSGYEEEARLYATMFELSLEQRETLRKGGDIRRFMDLLEEKEDILRLIGQIDDRMADAREDLMSGNPEDGPARERLGGLLDCVAMLIEDVRFVETSNALFLDGSCGLRDSAGSVPHPTTAANTPPRGNRRARRRT